MNKFIFLVASLTTLPAFLFPVTHVLSGIGKAPN